MRVLVVEDEPGVASFMRRGLECSSYAVDHVETGEEALKLLTSTNYSAVILDLALPGMDGLEVVREIRRRRMAIPVLAVTARGESEQHVEGLQAGCDVYLSKPFAFGELLAWLRAVHRRAGARSERVLTRGALSLDIDARAAVVRDRRIELTDREFQILLCLMRSVGEAVSREELFETVWGTKLDRTSNVLEVYINFLRRKLCPEDGSRLIRTVRGVGYQVED